MKSAEDTKPDMMRSRRSGDAIPAAAEALRQGGEEGAAVKSFAVWPLLDRFDKQAAWQRWLVLVLLIGLIGLVDYLSGYEASVASLYVVPIFLAGWSLGMGAGLLLALAASITLILTNWLAGQPYSASWVLVWNIVVRGGTFAALAALAASLRGQMERVHRLSLSDSLTSAWNRRAFYQALAVELARVERSPAPFSLVYVDLDNFKAINDHLGHSTGDDVLRAVVRGCHGALRLQDTVARLGGDEFAILLPGTDEKALEGLLIRLVERLKGTTRPHAPVTFSIGAMTFAKPPTCVNSALHLVDELMYQVKRGSKDSALIGRYPEPAD